MTEWRPVPEWEGLYDVSSEGQVRSTRRKGSAGGLLALPLNTNGYPSVGLTGNGRRVTRTVHTLVASAFLGPPPPGLEVRHLDGDKLNPSLANLTYGTQSENALDRRGHGQDHQVNKTHCPKGHPYEGDNVYTIASRPGARYCRTCNGWTGLGRTAPVVPGELVRQHKLSLTHCRNGHPYPPAGEGATRVNARGATVRFCQQCRADYLERARLKRKASA